MGTINREHFYYGVMLSTLVNNGKTPKLIENGKSSRIYMLSNGSKKCEAYSKYTTNPSGESASGWTRWDFSFNWQEVQRLISYKNSRVPFSLVLICGKAKCFQESEIAVLDIHQAETCLDPAYDRSSYRISVKVRKGQQKLRVYGTGLADEQNGKETAFRIPRNKFLYLEETE